MEKIADGELVKIDTKGRWQYKRERREALLEEFVRSGMSGQQFAKWAGIKYSTFAGWRQRQRRAKSAVSPGKKSLAPSSETKWVEAVVGKAALSAPSSRKPCLVVELGAGVRLEVSDQGQAHLAAMVLGELLSGVKRC